MITRLSSIGDAFAPDVDGSGTMDILYLGLIFGGPNDMAISLESMFGLPEGRQPKPEFLEVACDHLSYFNTEAGLTL